MKAGLKGIVAAGCLAFYSLVSPFSGFCDRKSVYDEMISIPKTDYLGKETTAHFRVKASLDDDIDTLFLGIYSENYDKSDWTEEEKEIPLAERYNSINHDFSEVLFFGPKRAKISEVEQFVYCVPKNKWISNLKSYEKSQTAQLILETIEKKIRKTISGVSSILGKGYDKGIEDTEQSAEDYAIQKLKDTNPDYVKTEIPFYIPTGIGWLGQTETAREYKIKFNLTTSKKLPSYFCLRIATGDSSREAYGSFPTKYGMLENIQISFTFSESSSSVETVDDLFLHEKEMNLIGLSLNRKPEETRTNKGILYKDELGKGAAAEGVSEIGFAEYDISNIGQGAKKRELSLVVMKFETSEKRGTFMSNRAEELIYPVFYKDNFLSFIRKPTIEDILNKSEDLTQEQISVCTKMFFNYMERTKMSGKFNKDWSRSAEILEELKELQKDSSD